LSVEKGKKAEKIIKIETSKITARGKH